MTCHDNCGKIKNYDGCSCHWNCYDDDNCCPDIRQECPYSKYFLFHLSLLIY